VRKLKILKEKFSLFFKKNRARKNDSIELGAPLYYYCPVSSATARWEVAPLRLLWPDQAPPVVWLVGRVSGISGLMLIEICQGTASRNRFDDWIVWLVVNWRHFQANRMFWLQLTYLTLKISFWNAHHSIALEKLYLKSFKSNSIWLSIRPPGGVKVRRSWKSALLPLSISDRCVRLIFLGPKDKV
jgi:hypothetical protein